MEYSEITVFTNTETAEIVAYFLQEVCDDGVSIYDKNDLYLNSSWDYKDETAEKYFGEEVMVKGYCKKEDTPRVLDFLRKNFQNLKNAGSLNIAVGTADGDGWVAKWKETFRPIETEKLVICPEWQSVTSDKAVLLLDTGVAFGTGQHETTSMCLSIAERLDLSGKRVLDVGCGSGILGLASLLLGTDSAELVDIDSQATDAAEHNAEINGLTAKACIKTGNLTERTSGVFDVVFANLTADILALLHKDIRNVTKKGSLLVLSGILDVKLGEVLALYGSDFDLLKTESKGEWRAVLLKCG